MVVLTCFITTANTRIQNLLFRPHHVFFFSLDMTIIIQYIIKSGWKAIIVDVGSR